MAHRYRKRVRFGEVDQAQIVYYPRVFHYCHLAMEDFFESQAGLAYVEIVEGRRVGFPAVHLEADFKAPMPFGAELTITLSIVRLGRSSVVTRYRFRDASGRDCAEALVTTACIDMDAFRSRSIPEDLRALFERHLEP
jgi:YbgC/YbaW family acyl-CoA thioester hydrolase